MSDLSEKCDWFLTHGVGVTNVCLDDFCERFLDSLKIQKTENTAGENEDCEKKLEQFDLYHKYFTSIISCM